jgi:starch synthase
MTTVAQPAIFFHPDGYSTEDRRVMGRRVAGRELLKAHFLRAVERGTERLTCHAAHRDLALDFMRLGREHGYEGKVRLVDLMATGPLEDDGTLYLPDPSLTPHAVYRERVGRARYSLTGVIHSLVSSETLELVASLATAPIAAWDALICTSRAGRAVVEAVLSQREQWLAERVGATRFTRPELPIIPLGVHVDDYLGLRQDKAEARAALGLPAEAKVVVYVGRLSVHAKAHPFPLYLALDRAIDKVGPIVLIECGSFGDASTGEAFAEMRASFPRLMGGVVGGAAPATEAQKLACLAAADVFVSLADNVQETFGLTVVEAMAAGLPVVVSDWDGYKDTVVDGEHGFRVDTHMPTAGAAEHIAAAYERRLIDYDRYVGYLSQHIIVDIDMAADRLVTLLTRPDLAARMGERGAERARSELSWAAVYPRYEALWAELADRRSSGQDSRSMAALPLPVEELYASFPSAMTPLGAPFRRGRVDRSALSLAGIRAALEGALPQEQARKLLDEHGIRQDAQADPEPLAVPTAKELGELHALAKYGLLDRPDPSA